MDNILNINLETSTTPKIVENKYKDWIEYGTDEYRNLFPMFLIDLYYNSSTHSAIINATADMIAGESIIAEESDNLDAYVKLKRFIANANSKEDLHTVFKKCAFDLKLHGSFALNVIWAKDKTSISEIHHVAMEKIRVGTPNEMGRVDTYYISADWSNTRKNKPVPVPAFNMNDRTSASQLLVDGLYSPNMDIYHTPDYVSGCNWALIDQKVAEFHLNNISNGFAGSYFISFANGVPSQEERLEIERSIAKKFTGEKAAGRFILTFSDDKNRTPEITPIDQSNADKQYLALQELLVQNILTAHRVTSPMLMGIRSDSGLGNNAQELIEAYDVYSNSVIRPFQEVLLKCFKKVLEINEINLPITIQQFKPISTRWSLDTLKEILTQDEIREEIGLEPLQDDEETLKEEEKEDYKKEGKERELQKCDCEKPSKDCEKKCDRYKETELESVVLEEDIINYINSLDFDNEIDFEEDYELIEEEQVENEEEDRLKYEEFVSASGKQARSRYDRELFKLRYVYRGGAIKDTSRDFCRNLIGSHYGSLFTREDIAGMRGQNEGFGSYNVLKYKGSYNCRHYWLRRVYVLKKAPRRMIIDGRIYQKGDYLPKELKNYYPRNKGYIPQDAGVPALDNVESAGSRINAKVK
tara:strand:+ start:1742 stop:3664 length:1923 start_codon:yes stop_codon:yes gene_type:complete